MKIKLLFILIILSFLSCSIKINKKFNYNNLITPKNMNSDIQDLKKNLATKHYDIDWEGKKSSIFNSLDAIKQINKRITIDSFEQELSSIINIIDDGHSRIIHQDSIQKSKRNQFGYQSITDSIAYIRIGNFRNTAYLLETLEKLRNSNHKNQKNILIIDIRSNPGGNIQNVKRTLTYFLASKTKIYENIKVKSTSMLSCISSKLLSAKTNLKYSKYTGKKKLKGDPKIYLWVNESIASGSMLLSYHLQNNGAFVIGETPKGIFNTFGNQYRYRLKYSKIIYTLASLKVNLTKQHSIRMEDMLTPNYIPKGNWKLSDIVDFINYRERITIDN